MSTMQAKAARQAEAAERDADYVIVNLLKNLTAEAEAARKVTIDPSNDESGRQTTTTYASLPTEER